MSDLQILTGLPILISGYSQLRCGLSVYHWQILVYLTWFCSLTHLSCLTILRTYLHNRPRERLWRLIGMGILVLLLIVALLPTGNYGVSNAPADYAICSFRRLAPIARKGEDDEDEEDDGKLDYASMVISVLLMGLGFLARIVRLHRGISVGILGASRTYLSECARKRLRLYYERQKDFSDASPWKSQTRTLFLYRPALALFLTCRAMLDLWSSMVVEVWWLVASFAWGVYNLALSMASYPKRTTDNMNWTFGQIAPVLLLSAPMLSVFVSLAGT